MRSRLTAGRVVAFVQRALGQLAERSGSAQSPGTPRAPHDRRRHNSARRDLGRRRAIRRSPARSAIESEGAPLPPTGALRPAPPPRRALPLRTVHRIGR